MKLNKTHRRSLIEQLQKAEADLSLEHSTLRSFEKDFREFKETKATKKGSHRLGVKLEEAVHWAEVGLMVAQLRVKSIQKLLVDNNNPDW